MTRKQLEHAGLTAAGISRWQDEQRLHRTYPGVYAVGHGCLAVEGKLAAALLYAGPGAGLSHVTAGWWIGMVSSCPPVFHVSTPGKRARLPDVQIYLRRDFERIWHKGLPLVPPAQILLDMAGQLRFKELRRALSDAVYLELVTLEEVEAQLGRGKPGSARLRTALECHRPELARTKSLLEEKFLLLGEQHSLIPPSGVNVRLAGYEVDFVWLEQKVVVELDGHAGHAKPAAIERDRRRDMDLRAAGYVVLRYTWQQVTRTPELVVADLLRHGVPARAARSRRSSPRSP